MSESGYSSDESNCDNFHKEEFSRFKSNYSVESLLLESANGKLYNAYCKRTHKEVVVKIIPKKARNMTWLEDGSRVPMEVKMHSIAAAADPTGTVGLLDVYQRKNDFIMVLEKPQNSIDLLEFVKNYGALSYSAALEVVKQLARSSLLHRQAGVIHRDLKDENVLFNPATCTCKVIDFGCAGRYNGNIATFVGTDAYAPPELLDNKNHHANIDAVTVYSIGCILFIIVTATNPFDEEHVFDFQRHILLSPNLSKQERTILSFLLNPDPNKRIPLSELVELKL